VLGGAAALDGYETKLASLLLSRVEPKLTTYLAPVRTVGYKYDKRNSDGSLSRARRM